MPLSTGSSRFGHWKANGAEPCRQLQQERMDRKRQPRWGERQSKINNEMVEYLLSKIESKLTSEGSLELKDQMTVDLPNKPAVSHQAISKKLYELLYAVNNVKAVPVHWNMRRFTIAASALLCIWLYILFKSVPSFVNHIVQHMPSCKREDDILLESF